jgi:hypothetical protein
VVAVIIDPIEPVSVDPVNPLVRRVVVERLDTVTDDIDAVVPDNVE